MHSSGWAWYRDDDEGHRREDNARFRAVLGHCPKCIAVLDESGNLVGYNEEFKSLFEAPPPLGAPVATLLDDGPRAMLAEVVANAGTQRRAGAIVTMRTTAGGEREVEFLAATLPGDAPRSIGVVMAADDRTASAQEEARRALVVRGIGDANCHRAIDLAEAAVCHDLNNVFTVLTLALAALRQRSGDGEPQTSALLQELDAAVQQGSSIVARARARSRGLPGVVAAPVEDSSVRDVLNDALAVVAPLARRARASLVARIASDARVPVAGSELTQVVTNLLTNAVHAIEEAKRPGRIDVTVERAGASITIAVRDDGVGIEPSRLVDSFEAFQTTRAASGGTGLGLAIAREIVAGAGGHIDVVSTPGSGTQMRVELPVADAVADRSAATTPSPQRSQGGQGGRGE
jgi:signal transduction histidine kinase